MIAVILFAAGLVSHARAVDYVDGFDGPEKSWLIRYDKKHARIVTHERTTAVTHAGTACEQFTVVADREGALIRLEHALPPSLRIDDLKLRIQVRSNRRGIGLGLRVVLPSQRNPRTGELLAVTLRGSVYGRAGEWQQLECQTLEKDLRKQINYLRAQLNTTEIDARDAFVDRVLLAVNVPKGATEILVDSLVFGPIVASTHQPEVMHASAEEGHRAPPVEFRLDRLLVEGRPFFPRIAPFHGEDAGQLADCGLNMIWPPDFRDDALLKSLRQSGLWTMATPPRAVSPTGEILDAKDASLVPFSPATSPILMWYLGTQISPDARADLVDWVEQIRGADRKFRRPMTADVAGREDLFSQYVSMTGTSQHIVNTSLSFGQYRELLKQNRLMARPGSFVWTWIQTDSATIHGGQPNSTAESQIVVEPEQIRLQVYAALAAGCRGIAYWTGSKIDGNAAGDLERRLAITQLNLELELLEPWLATGTLNEPVAFEVGNRQAERLSQIGTGFRNLQPNRFERDTIPQALKAALRQDANTTTELQAAVIRNNEFGAGLLLLPVWYQQHAQYVPGQMVAHDAKLVVPWGVDSAMPWQLTTTGIQVLSSRRVAGGIEITLPKFDQTAAIIVTSDRNLIERIQRKVGTLKQKSARVSVDLARAKLQRVADVDQQLNQLGHGQPDSQPLLIRAQEFIDQAEQAFSHGEYHAARERSGDALQLMRILQRAHWHQAVRRLASPAASPYAVCFQTLPAHWKLIEQIGRSPIKPDDNLLRSGDFEDRDTWIIDGWEHEQTPIRGVYASAELYSVAHAGEFSLRMFAGPAPNADPPTVITSSPVTVTTPAMLVRSGQIVYISGWVRVSGPVTGTPLGATLTDSLTGRMGTLRWHSQQDWHRFEMIRNVQQSGEFRLTFSLNGLGEVLIDDLQVVPLDSVAAPREDRAQAEPAETPVGALDFFSDSLRSR